MTPIDRQDWRCWPWMPVASPAIHNKRLRTTPAVLFAVSFTVDGDAL